MTFQSTYESALRTLGLALPDEAYPKLKEAMRGVWNAALGDAYEIVLAAPLESRHDAAPYSTPECAAMAVVAGAKIRALMAQGEKT